MLNLRSQYIYFCDFYNSLKYDNINNINETSIKNYHQFLFQLLNLEIKN